MGGAVVLVSDELDVVSLRIYQQVGTPSSRAITVETVRPTPGGEAFAEHIEFAEKSYVDHKTEAQEYLAKAGKTVVYRVLGYSGPPHERKFEVEATVDGRRRAIPWRSLSPL